jgi:CRP/FNR family cyclic AMP-dependent transcriptional regulator
MPLGANTGGARGDSHVREISDGGGVATGQMRSGASSRLLPRGQPEPVANTMVERHDRLNMPAFLASVGVGSTPVLYARGAGIFTQGEACEHVWHIQSGTVKLSVVSTVGKEAVVAVLGPGDFLGEAGLAGVPSHGYSATALVPSAILMIGKAQMLRLLHEHHALSDRFIAHMLARNIRIEEELVDHVFSSSEKRLARTLLRLAREGTEDTPACLLPKMSQGTLAEMVGTTRSRINFF